MLHVEAVGVGPVLVTGDVAPSPKVPLVKPVLVVAGVEAGPEMMEVDWPAMTSTNVIALPEFETVAVVAGAPNCEAGNAKYEVTPATTAVEVIGWLLAVMIDVAQPAHGTMICNGTTTTVVVVAVVG